MKQCAMWLAGMVCVAGLTGCDELQFRLKNACITYTDGQELGLVSDSFFSIENQNETTELYMIKVPEATAQKYKFFRRFPTILPGGVGGEILEQIPYTGSGELVIDGSILDGSFSSVSNFAFFKVAPMQPIATDMMDTITVISTINRQRVEQLLTIKATYLSGDFLQDLNRVLQALAGVADAEMIVATQFGLEKDKVRQLSFGNQAARAATGPESIVATTAEQGPLPAAPTPEKEFDGFPCGDGPNGFTVCPSMLAARPVTGDAYYVSMILEEDVILDDPDYFYTYAFVFDGDGATGNNWVALPQFPNDFFQGTDHWYQVQYDPITGTWDIMFQLARNGFIAEFPTYAHAVIAGNSITLVVPMGDFNVAEPRFRLTAFRQPGDFGAGGDWEADLDPDIDNGLLSFYPIDGATVPFEE